MEEPKPKLRIRLLRALPVVVLALCVLGTLLQLTIRDRVPGLALLFYGTPRPLLGLLALLALPAVGLRKRKAPLAVALLVFVVIGLWPLLGLGGSTSPPNGVTPIRAMLWNVARGAGGWNDVVETIRRESPDIVTLIEVAGDGAGERAYWTERFGDYAVSRVRYSMLLMVRGELTPGPYGYLDPISRYHRYRTFRAVVNGKEMQIVTVDVSSGPFLTRRTPLEGLAKLLASLPDGPVLVMGDFNTPSLSVHFDALPERFANAFGRHSWGAPPTWPSCLPVLDLDQIWTAGVTIHNAETRWTIQSDHKPVVVGFTVAE